MTGRNGACDAPSAGKASADEIEERSKKMTIHRRYRQLQEVADNGIGEQATHACNIVDCIDEVMSKLFEEAKARSLTLAGDDRAARVAEAMAVAFVASDEGLKIHIQDITGER
jgi:hypothetical protein